MMSSDTLFGARRSPGLLSNEEVSHTDLEKGLQEPPGICMTVTRWWMSLLLLMWFIADQWPLSVTRARLF